MLGLRLRVWGFGVRGGCDVSVVLGHYGFFERILCGLWSVIFGFEIGFAIRRRSSSSSSSSSHFPCRTFHGVWV